MSVFDGVQLLIQWCSMAVVHEYPPNYAASQTTYNTPPGPVVTSANFPAGTTLFDRINGLMNCVFAYGGATLFNELMAEMRRPYVRHIKVRNASYANTISVVKVRLLERLPLCRNLHFLCLYNYRHGCL